MALIGRCAMHLGMDARTFDWNHARAFLATAEQGSFSAAALALGVAQPTVGRQVAALEDELGVTLFERVGRGVQLTAAGLDLAEHVRAMRDAAERASLTAAGESLSLEGVVCITASEFVAVYVLPPIVRRIREAHLGIELELVGSNETQDLRRREADIAIRNYRPDDPELVTRRLRDGAMRFYATPAYLDRIGRPTCAADLSRVQFFRFDRTDAMITALDKVGVHVAAESFPIVSASHAVHWELAKQGLGACVMIEEVGDREPAVCRVLDDLPPLPIPMWLTSHRGLRTTRRLRVVFDLLAEALSEPPGRSDPP
jgi:DNA-binding transcriptional LysR family regulator